MLVEPSMSYTALATSRHISRCAHAGACTQILGVVEAGDQRLGARQARHNVAEAYIGRLHCERVAALRPALAVQYVLLA